MVCYKSQILKRKTMDKKRIFLLIILIVFFAQGYGQQSNNKKSVAGALLRSIAVPGWGEIYAENYSAAKWTFSAEITVWASYFFFIAKSNWMEDDYKNIALSYATVSTKDRDKQYWIDVGESSDIFSHNEGAARRRDKEAIYTDTDTYYWYWENQNKRADYNHLRISSGRIEEYAKIVISGALLTRLVSSVIAVRSVKRYNRDIVDDNSPDVSFNIKPVIDSRFKWIPYAQVNIAF